MRLAKRTENNPVRAEMSGSPAMISLSDVCKSFVAHGDRVTVLENLSLSVAKGEFLAIVGPSGSGKSTLLNIIAGIEPPSSGTIHYDGKPMRGVSTHVGYLTQHDSLLPWRTVAENIAVPLEIRHVLRHESQAQVSAIVRTVGLSGFERHHPRQLSGGMRKRVMLARTLVYDPETILMDEPFGPLDAQLKTVLQGELLRLWSNSRKTIVFVTHDIVEAITLADRVVVLSSRPGRIKLIEHISLDRPRDVHGVRFLPAFEDHYRRLWDSIEVDVRREASR